MQTKNVYYATQPDAVIITENGGKAVIEFPVNVTEIELEEGTQYLAESVYYLNTRSTPNLRQRVEANYDAWLEKAKADEPQEEEAVDTVEILLDILEGNR